MKSQPLKEEIIETDIAMGSGYTESKWVTEEILFRNSKQTSLRIAIVRVGQLCGGKNGAWNKQEWFPSLVWRANTLKCLSVNDKLVSWIPLDLTAHVMVDFCDSQPETPTTVAHLVHPNPVSLSLIMEVIADDFTVPTIPYNQWLQHLEALKEGNSGAGESAAVKLQTEVPALRLLEIFRGIGKMEGVPSRETLGFLCLDITKALSLSTTLANPEVRKLGGTEVRAWLQYWKGAGMISD
ncbi:hypothetical protein M422DRAFT_154911 [Sphaerobolus stellatus SS14]|nr:hypothetical protein M422DRAFT_154911 [Sphaerobolus stellatus SS14]